MQSPETVDQATVDHSIAYLDEEFGMYLPRTSAGPGSFLIAVVILFAALVSFSGLYFLLSKLWEAFTRWL
jgi:hypothetical protein